MRIFIILAFFMFSCSLTENADKCDPAGAALTESNIVIPVILYRSPSTMELTYTPGDCDLPDVIWKAGPYESLVSSTLSFPGKSSFTGTFKESGEVCVQVVKDSNSSNEICSNFEVITDDVWQANQETPYPGQPTNRTLVFSVGDYVYAGFGEVNEWYRFHVGNWEWEELSGVDQLTFEAYTGFETEGTIYILGQNNFLYSYSIDADSWNVEAEFKLNLENTFELEQQSNVDNAAQFLFPFVGSGINGKGYVGVGGSGRFFEYDIAGKNWTELAPYPEPGLKDANWFKWDNKIFLGKYYYDPATDEWNSAPNRYSEDEFNKFFVVMDDGVYFQNSVGTTRKFNGNTTVDYSPRPLFSNERAPGGATGVGRAGVVGEIAIIPKSFHNGRKFANFDYYVRSLR